MSLCVCFLLWFFVISVFAYKEFSYNSAKNIAIDYIQNSSFDENWNWKNPTISWDGKYFYTDTNNPSYIEFKVSCDNEPNCWFIMVNFDGNDVSIPVSSTSWNTPSEVLTVKNGNDNNNFYYFSPFEQYAENEITGNVSSINPQDDEVLTNKASKSVSTYNKSNWKNTLKEKLDNAKKESAKFKKSEEFKKLKKELKENKLTVPNDEISFKVLDMAMASYKEVASSNKFIPWNEYSWCKWKVPCYQQFSTKYNWVTCAVGCIPLAYGMIYWYYDRIWLYPDLLKETVAPTLNNSSVNDMVTELGIYLKTSCTEDWVWVTKGSVSDKWIEYAKNKWYSWSVAERISWTTYELFHNHIKSEINNWRPVIVNTKTHWFVAYGYLNTNLVNTKIIRVNLWVWPDYKINGLNKSYYWSSIDYDMDSIFYDNQNKWWIINVVKVKIMN